jgi:hypothetical protein
MNIFAALSPQKGKNVCFKAQIKILFCKMPGVNKNLLIFFKVLNLIYYNMAKQRTLVRKSMPCQYDCYVLTINYGKCVFEVVLAYKFRTSMALL